MKDIYQNKKIISLGNFLFKHRNYIFPLIVLVIFIIMPPVNGLFGVDSLAIFKDRLAVTLCIIGLLIRAGVIGLAYIKRGGMNKQVYADNLVTTGIFAICRNPLYVGNVIIYAGIFLKNGNLLVFILGSLLFFFVYICLIAAEEAYLRGKFGAEFDAYCAKAPRWIPKLSGFNDAVSGMSFDFKKVILKDYTTALNTFFILVLTEFYEQIKYAPDNGALPELVIYFLMIIIGLMSIKSYKKKHAADAAADGQGV